MDVDDHRSDRRLRDHHRAEDRLLGFEILRRDVCVGGGHQLSGERFSAKADVSVGMCLLIRGQGAAEFAPCERRSPIEPEPDPRGTGQTRSDGEKKRSSR